MEEWTVMFRGVQAIVRSGASMNEALYATVEMARNNPGVFPSQEYWDIVKQHISQLPMDMIVEWAEIGLQSVREGEGWGLLLLDLGDCPEIFRLYTPGDEALMDEQKVRHQLFSEVVIGYDDIVEHCLEDALTLQGEHLFDRGYHVWVNENVRELDDELLSWTNGSDRDYNENSGYLLWLAVGSLALLDPLRDAVYCSRVLQDRERIYLLAGYEEIFFYLATVTHSGLLFEEHSIAGEK